MTRKDLIDRVAKKFGLKKKEAEAIVKFIFQEIAETVKKGERVSIQGFGAFELRELKERKIRNPRTGEVVRVPKKEKVVFVDRITFAR
jgi:nucleoid DNA-binding protein